MQDQDQDRIRRRAHEIWEREGRPEGREREHWDRACREVGAGGGPVRQEGSEQTVDQVEPDQAAQAVQSATGQPGDEPTPV